MTRASVDVADLFVAVHELAGLARSDGGYDLMTLWIDADVRASEEWGAVRDCGQKAASVLAEGVKQLKEAQAFLAGACSPAGGRPGRVLQVPG